MRLDAGDIAYAKTSYQRVRSRVVDALVSTDTEESIQLAHRISECGKSSQKHLAKWLKDKERFQLSEEFNPIYRTMSANNQDKKTGSCQSLWCLRCRKVVATVYLNKLRQRLSEKLSPGPYTNFDLKHLTGVVGVCELSVDAVGKLLKRDTDRWRRIRYRVQNDIPVSRSPFIEAVYEFEVVDWKALRGVSDERSRYKRAQMEELVSHYKIKGDKLVFVHWHGITNLRDREVDGAFGDEYFVAGKSLIKTNKKNGLFVQAFHKDKSLDENLRRVSSYPFKSAYRYKHSFIGSDFQNGEYIESSELSRLVMLYNKLQKRNWRGLFRSVDLTSAVDIAKYRDRYPHDHPIWENWKHIFKLEKVYLVDASGVVYVSGWDPNTALDTQKSTYKYTIVRQRVVGRELFAHPEYPWITAYKNVWGGWDKCWYDGKTPLPTLTNTMSFDQFYEFTRKKMVERRRTVKSAVGGYDAYRYLLVDEDASRKGGGKSVGKYKPSPVFETGDLVAHTAVGIHRSLDVEREFVDRCLRFLETLGDLQRKHRISSRLKLTERLSALWSVRSVLDLSAVVTSETEWEDGYEWMDYDEDDEDQDADAYEDEDDHDDADEGGLVGVWEEGYEWMEYEVDDD